MISEWFGVAPWQLVLIGLVAAVAGFVRGLTGFGLAIILVPLVTLIIPPERTVMLAIVMATLGGGLGYREAWKTVDRGNIVKLLIAASVATPVGMYALSITPPDLARILIAAIAVGAFFVIAMKRAPLPPAGNLPIYATGMMMGFLGSFAAIPGPPVIHYYVRDGIPAQVSRDTMIVIFLWGPLMVTLLAIAVGKVDLQLGLLALAVTPALMAGNTLGSRYFGRLPESQWRWLILGLIGVSAAGSVIHLLA